MIRAIVGLGNPLPQYIKTRHNFGRMAVEALREKENLEWKSHFWKNYRWCQTNCGTWLAISKTYMNTSGEAVRSLARSLKLAPEEILVLLDDCQLPLGKLRYRHAGSDGGHNGLRSVIACLGTEDVPRLRLGIGKSPLPLVEHVLGNFEAEEQETVAAAINFLTNRLPKVSLDEEKIINEINNWRAPAYADASN